MSELPSLTIGGKKVDLTRALTACLWTLVALCALGTISLVPVTSGIKHTGVLEKLLKPWLVEGGSPPPGDAAALYAILIIWGLMLGLGYVLFGESLPGNRWSKGAVYGTGAWALGILVAELMDVQTTKIPAYVILVLWILLWLPIMLIIGMLLSYLYPERPRRLRGGEPPGPEPKRSWSDLWKDLWRYRWVLLASAVLSTLALGAIGALFWFVIAKPTRSALWIFRTALAQGHITFNQMLGIGAVGALWAVLFTLFYFMVRPGAPFKGVKSGLFFGAWVWGMMTLPLLAIFFPVTTLPTSFILWITLVAPLIVFMAMGAINGVLLKYAEGRGWVRAGTGDAAPATGSGA